MKNLKLNNHNIRKFNSKKLSRICIDPVTKSIFIVDSNEILEVKVGEDDGTSTSLHQKWLDFGINVTLVISVEVITSLSSVCVITRDGDVISIRIADGLTEVVGSGSDGFLTASWSPDQEQLILVTPTSNVIMMTANFEPIAEFSLEQEGFGENAFMNVGWGKKETQFHGSEGKQSALKGKPSLKQIDENDDKIPRVSWRGDGELFAVHYVCSDTQTRKFRVVNREGIIQFTSEYVEGLEHAFDWRPSGNLIVSSQRLTNKHNIVFFEKNGLQHGEFVLPYSANEMRVNEIYWNEDSSVLLVWLTPIGESLDKNVIQLWTTGNYHWYLKEELVFTEDLYSLSWDPEKPLLLHVLTSEHLHQYNWILNNDISLGKDISDLSQAAVIDGRKILVTPFRQTIIPPPICAYEISLPNQAHSIIYAPPQKQDMISPNNSQSVEDSGFLEVCETPGNNSNNMCIHHGKNMLTFLCQANSNEQLAEFNCNVKVTGAGGNGFIVKTKVHRVVGQHIIEFGEADIVPSLTPGCFYNWLWLKSNVLSCIYRDNSTYYFIMFDLECIGSPNGRVVSRNIILLEDAVITSSLSPDGSSVFLQLITGNLVFLKIEEDNVVFDDANIKFPTTCDKVEFCSLDNGEIYRPFGLSPRNRLYIADLQLLSDCTSFHIHNDHLLLTTSSHQLLVIPLLSKSLKSLSEGTREQFANIGSRRLERGSRVINSVPCDSRVILQMPRGNLEVISPRPLVIHALKHLLNNQNYYIAVDIMRRNRIDLNLIYDHKPETFINDIENFIKSIKNSQWLDLFIASLNKEDVTQTMYSHSYERKGLIENIDKVNTVCTAMRNAMILIDEQKYLLPILSTYMKSTDDEMHLALKRLNEMRVSKEAFKVSFEEGLQHVLYVADANQLCDVALGTYDFDLIMMVYEKSQKDPKEYLPFLNQLKEYNEDYCKFKIDVHLKHYKKAFDNLNKSENINSYLDECLSLIKKECLYRDAIDIFTEDSVLYQNTCVAFGDYLDQKGYYNEAALMYFRAKKFDVALLSFIKANNWKRCLIVASILNYSREKLSSLCQLLVEQLKMKDASEKYCEAAYIYENYLNSEEDAVECFVRGNKFEEALRVACKHKRGDLIETHIQPFIIQHFYQLDEEICRMREDFVTYCDRLVIVRDTKTREYLDLLDGKGDDHFDSDLYSDASTVTGASRKSSNRSSASGKSYRSSKNKRKQERKRHSTKEGSNFEDLGLVTALHQLIGNVEKLSINVSDLNVSLLSFGEDKKASKLQEGLDDLIQIIKKNVNVIWPKVNESESDEPEFGPGMSTNAALSQMKMGDSRYNTSFMIQRMNELDPHLRFSPNIEKISNWKLYSLRKSL